jgi:hypothetical protein
MSEKPDKKEKDPKYKFLGGKATIGRKIKAVGLLSESFFNIAWLCKQINIQRRSFNRWRECDPEFERACQDVQEEIYDEAEVLLQKKMRENDTTSLIFFLKTKCKQRGYVEKKEIEHIGAVPVMTKEEREAEIKRLLGK